MYFLLLQPPGGSSNLWDLVSVINGQDDSLLPGSYSRGVMHMKHLLKFKTVRVTVATESSSQVQKLLNYPETVCYKFVTGSHSNQNGLTQIVFHSTY